MIGEDENVQKLYVAIQNWQQRQGGVNNGANLGDIGQFTLSAYLGKLGFVITAP